MICRLLSWPSPSGPCFGASQEHFNNLVLTYIAPLRPLGSFVCVPTRLRYP